MNPRIKAMEDKFNQSTQGEWSAKHGIGGSFLDHPEIELIEDDSLDPENVEFIAAAHNEMPYLLERAKKADVLEIHMKDFAAAFQQAITVAAQYDLKIQDLEKQLAVSKLELQKANVELALYKTMAEG